MVKKNLGIFGLLIIIIVIMIIIFQKHLVKGLGAGAVKG